MFDVARRLLVADVEGGTEIGRREQEIRQTDLPGRAKQVSEFGVSVLICGAISRPLELLLRSEGVQVIPLRCGPMEDVLAAFLAEELTPESFLMPGCCGRRRRIRGRHGPGRPWPDR